MLKIWAKNLLRWWRYVFLSNRATMRGCPPLSFCFEYACAFFFTLSSSTQVWSHSGVIRCRSWQDSQPVGLKFKIQQTVPWPMQRMKRSCTAPDGLIWVRWIRGRSHLWKRQFCLWSKKEHGDQQLPLWNSKRIPHTISTHQPVTLLVARRFTPNFVRLHQWYVWLPEALQGGVLRVYEEWWPGQDP